VFSFKFQFAKCKSTSATKKLTTTRYKFHPYEMKLQCGKSKFQDGRLELVFGNIELRINGTELELTNLKLIGAILELQIETFKVTHYNKACQLSKSIDFSYSNKYIYEFILRCFAKIAQIKNKLPKLTNPTICINYPKGCFFK
jgi:hypothetical protein